MHSVFAEYLVFLLEVVTVTVAIGALIALAAAVFNRRRGSPSGKFRIHKLNERFENMANAIGDASLTASDRKAAHKRRAKELKRIDKERSAATAERKRVFVIDFKGDIRASRVRSMREEVTAVVGAAQAGDERRSGYCALRATLSAPLLTATARQALRSSTALRSARSS